MAKIGLASLGCPKNQVDAEIMLSKLKNAGYELTPFEEEADAILVNTCGFIESAKQEAIDTILELAALKKEGKLKALIVTGCLAERYRKQLMEQISEIDAAVSIGRNAEIVEIVNRALDGERTGYFGTNEGLPLEGKRILINEPYYAYLKIGEGCNNCCSYCAIPLIRGKMRSRTIESVLEEANTLASSGVKELVIVAQDTTRYGEDIYGKCELPRLLQELCKIEKIHWIRVLYTYPDRITDELLDVIADQKKIVKYLDMPIQHCNGEILRRMNRPGDRESLCNTIRKIRERVPGIVLRTTLIAGFPGETQEQFEELCEFVRDMRFERLGCFAYSAEEDTPAAEFDDQIPEELKQKRQEIVMEHQSFITAEIAEGLEGQTMEVLTEGYDSYIKRFYGRSFADAPDIDCKVFFTGKEKYEPGQFVSVKITGALDMDLLGETV